MGGGLWIGAGWSEKIKFEIDFFLKQLNFFGGVRGDEVGAWKIKI